MDLILQHKVEQFGELALAAGWEWCGVQESIPPVLPVLVIQKWGVIKRIYFDPNDFEPIKTATLLFAPTEKKMTDTPKLNLRQKLIKIYDEIDHVEKAGRNAKQNYNFVRAADVLRVVRDAFAKFGVYAETNYKLLGTYDIKTNSGGNMHTATVQATIVLFDADSDETKTISGLGDGADGGDKGIYKAQTGSTKNALRNGFLLPDEADPEADTNVDDRVAPEPYSDASSTPLPDYLEYPKPAPRPTAASVPVSDGSNPPAPFTETPQSSGATAAVVPSNTETAQAAAPERGDAYEGPDDNGALPTEEELVGYRAKFTQIANELTADGKLTASKSLPVNRKITVFLVSVTGAVDAKHVTKVQWDNFFQRADAAKANPAVGLVGLGKLVNKANGIEPKK